MKAAANRNNRERNSAMGGVMRGIVRALMRAFTVGALLSVAFVPASAAAGAKDHKVSIQVDQNDPEIMNLVLNNATNVLEYYQGKGEEVQIEIVAYGPGLHMLRDDTSPVKDRIKQLAEVSFPSRIKLSACENTRRGMEKREGHAITIIPQASIVPSGVVRLMELQEEGWTYVRP